MDMLLIILWKKMAGKKDYFIIQKII